MKTEREVIEEGYSQLTGKDIKQRAVGKRVSGDYLYGFNYIGLIHFDGTVEGENNVGARHKGTWFIDFEKNTLTFEWEIGWDNWTAKAYDINGEVHFYDVETGNWRTSFKNFIGD